MKERKVKQVFSGGEYQWEGGGHKETVKEGEYGGYILYSCMKIEQRNLFKLSYEWGREIRKNDVEGKSN
jgi:hypothetical protein